MMKIAKLQVLLAVSAAALSVASAASELPKHFELKSVQVTLPTSKSRFPAGPGAALANGYCLMCHSTGMVYRQPPLSLKDWQTEVAKMRKVFGCPLPEDKVAVLAAYMYRLNGAGKVGRSPTAPRPRRRA